MTPFDLAGQVALVTGASSGLGERFATILAEAGATVVVAARRRSKLDALVATIEQAGGKALAVTMDVADIHSIRVGVEAAETEAGAPIDVLVNNAGIGGTAALLDIEPDAYDALMATNARGVFFTAQAVARRMIGTGRGGRIVNIASAVAQKPVRQIGVYGMTKAAVVHMTRTMSLEWARHGINVNALCPGYIETDINRHHWETEGGRRLLATLPRRRVGQPEDLDGLLLLLASPASHFINGAALVADDGLAAG